MGTDFSSEDVDNAEEVGEIIAAVQENIDSLKTFIAKRDVEIVRRATKGMGTDEASLINSLCNRTKKQLETVDTLYHEKYESSLLSVVSEEVSGNFGKMVTYSLMETDDYGAEIFSAATEGLGTKERVLIDLVHTHTNEQLAAIKEKWEAKNNESMLDSVTDELGGNARRILLMLLMGEKSESDEVDPDLATEQAATLQEALASDLLGSEEDPFLDILGTQSRAQIQEIKAAYERDHGMSLMRAINKASRGTYKRCLLGCLFPSSEAYTAYALFKAFEGLGTDEDRVTRILGGTDKKKMVAVNAYYKETYGKHLVEDLKEELSGTFLKAAMSWAAGTDPTRGMEGITARLADEVEEDPDKERDLAKALLQERLNLRDFICQADAEDIRAATHGLGTDDSLMVSIICSRSKAHLARVDHHYKAMFGKTLSRQIRQECFGTYREFLTYTMMSEADFDALTLKKSMDGIGTKEKLMIFVIAPQNNARVLAARARYDEKYGTALIDRVKSELRGDLEKAVVALINGSRQEDVVDEGLAEQQAQELYDAGIGKRFGTDEDTFIRILTEASREQIQLIRQFYEQNHDMSLERAIKKEFSGDLERLLLALIMEPLAFYASQLNKAFDGIKTDRSLVARVLGSNDKHFVRQLDLYYQDTYGETLMEALKRETGGKFRRAVLTWVCSSDPEHPANTLEEAFDGLEDEEEEEEEEAEEDREVEPEPEPEPEEECEPPPPSYEESAAEYSQYYEPPPPTSGYYVIGFVRESQVQRHRGPPPPYDDEGFDDLDDEDDDDMDEYFVEPIEGASDEQMMELRRLARIRTRALMMGDPHVVNRAQDRIRYLKWEIECNA